MKSYFEFQTDEQSHAYCMEIVTAMQRLFGISEEEAIGRMNILWKGLTLVGSEDLIYHEIEEYWANTIYYGKQSLWWTNPPDLTPLPYPR